MRIWVSNPPVIANRQYSATIFNFHIGLAWVNNDPFYCSWIRVTWVRNHFGAAREWRCRLVTWQGRILCAAIRIFRWRRYILHCNNNRSQDEITVWCVLNIDNVDNLKSVLWIRIIDLTVDNLQKAQKKSRNLFQKGAGVINDKGIEGLHLSLLCWFQVTNPGSTSEFGSALYCRAVTTFDSEWSDENSGACPLWVENGNEELLSDLPEQKQSKTKNTMTSTSE